jgi:hypothetical protein
MTAGGIELLLRDVYFETSGRGWYVPYLLVVASLVFALYRLTGFIRGDRFTTEGTLTEQGGFFVITLLIFAYGAVGVLKSQQIRSRREKPREEKTK